MNESYINGNNLEEFIKEFKADRYTLDYKSMEGKQCWKTFADEKWYLYKVKKYNFTFKKVNSHWEAISPDLKYLLDYIEGDVILTEGN